VNGHASWRRLTNVEEPLDDAAARSGAIDEEQIFVLEAGVCELLGVVQPLVKPDDGGYAVAAKVAEVMIRGMQWVAVLYPAAVVGTSKCQELAWKTKRKGITIRQRISIDILQEGTNPVIK